MTNWPKTLRDFIQSQGEQGNWKETNPDWAHIRWPFRVSRDYLRHAARTGQNLIWITLARSTVRVETERVVTGVLTVDVNCYARARSDNEEHVDDAQQRAANMRDEANRLIKLNVDQIAPAWITRIGSGERELLETGVVPCFFTQILPIEFHHEET